MSMLAGQVDYVIGVDTHRDTNTAAVVTDAGAIIAQQQCTTDAMGYRRVVAFADEHAPGRRVWAIEGTGSFGSGLTTHLLERGEWVVEIDRPARPARRDGAKTGADRDERLVESRPGAGGAGVGAVEVNVFGVDAEVEQDLPVGLEVLLVGRAAGVADQH